MCFGAYAARRTIDTLECNLEKNGDSEDGGVTNIPRASIVNLLNVLATATAARNVIGVVNQRVALKGSMHELFIHDIAGPEIKYLSHGRDGSEEVFVC